MNRRRVLAEPGARVTGAGGPGLRVERRPGVLWRRLGQDLLVLGPEPSPVRRVRAPGGLVWELLARPVVVAELVAELAAVTGSSEDEIRPGLEDLLAAWAVDGIVGVR